MFVELKKVFKKLVMKEWLAFNHLDLALDTNPKQTVSFFKVTM